MCASKEEGDNSRIILPVCSCAVCMLLAGVELLGTPFCLVVRCYCREKGDLKGHGPCLLCVRVLLNFSRSSVLRL
jgi:hypothetical protein